VLGAYVPEAIAARLGASRWKARVRPGAQGTESS
jgi:hypothetical protein